MSDWVQANARGDVPGGGASVDQPEGVYAVRARTAVAVPLTTIHLIPLEINDFDSDAMHDTVVDNTKIFINTAGTYVSGYDLLVNGVTAVELRVSLLLNGGAVVSRAPWLGTTNVQGTRLCFSQLNLPSVVGDYWELAVQCNGHSLIVATVCFRLLKF